MREKQKKTRINSANAAENARLVTLLPYYLITVRSSLIPCTPVDLQPFTCQCVKRSKNFAKPIDAQKSLTFIIVHSSR